MWLVFFPNIGNKILDIFCIFSSVFCSFLYKNMKSGAGKTIPSMNITYKNMLSQGNKYQTLDDSRFISDCHIHGKPILDYVLESSKHVTAIRGSPGCGKTTFVMKMIRDMVETEEIDYNEVLMISGRKCYAYSLKKTLIQEEIPVNMYLDNDVTNDGVVVCSLESFIKFIEYNGIGADGFKLLIVDEYNLIVEVLLGMTMHNRRPDLVLKMLSILTQHIQCLFIDAFMTEEDIQGINILCKNSINILDHKYADEESKRFITRYQHTGKWFEQLCFDVGKCLNNRRKRQKNNTTIYIYSSRNDKMEYLIHSVMRECQLAPELVRSLTGSDEDEMKQNIILNQEEFKKYVIVWGTSSINAGVDISVKDCFMRSYGYFTLDDPLSNVQGVARVRYPYLREAYVTIYCNSGAKIKKHTERGEVREDIMQNTNNMSRISKSAAKCLQNSMHIESIFRDGTVTFQINKLEEHLMEFLIHVVIQSNKRQNEPLKCMRDSVNNISGWTWDTVMVNSRGKRSERKLVDNGREYKRILIKNNPTVAVKVHKKLIDCRYITYVDGRYEECNDFFFEGEMLSSNALHNITYVIHQDLNEDQWNNKIIQEFCHNKYEFFINNPMYIIGEKLSELLGCYYAIDRINLLNNWKDGVLSFSVYNNKFIEERFLFLYNELSKTLVQIPNIQLSLRKIHNFSKYAPNYAAMGKNVRDLLIHFGFHCSDYVKGVFTIPAYDILCVVHYINSLNKETQMKPFPFVEKDFRSNFDFMGINSYKDYLNYYNQHRLSKLTSK